MKNKPIKLVSIDLEREDLLFTESFIKKLGGRIKAKAHLLDIIDRYFTTEYIDPELWITTNYGRT